VILLEPLEEDRKYMIRSPHIFPAIHPTSKNTRQDDHRFRPLFQTPADLPIPDNNSPSNSTQSGNGSDPLTVALKESYERGFKVGNKDACTLAQQELEPSLQGFFNRLNDFSETFSQFTHGQAAHIVTLALSIAGKLSSSCQMPKADTMLPVQEALDEGLRRHHQLELQLNKEDMEELADLMRCRGIELNHSGVVRICDNEDIPRGAPRRGPSSAAIETLREQIAQTIEDLP
jgi:hypothetical protein